MSKRWQRGHRRVISLLILSTCSNLFVCTSHSLSEVGHIGRTSVGGASRKCDTPSQLSPSSRLRGPRHQKRGRQLGNPALPAAERG